MKDLFEDYEALPNKVKFILTKYGECRSFDKCADLVKDLEELGYTCDYGLDAVPYDLRKL